MSTFIRHICKCDSCRATRDVSDSMEVPRGWSEARFFYGTVAHVCERSSCRKWIVEFSREHGIDLFPPANNAEGGK